MTLHQLFSQLWSELLKERSKRVYFYATIIVCKLISDLIIKCRIISDYLKT